MCDHQNDHGVVIYDPLIDRHVNDADPLTAGERAGLAGVWVLLGLFWGVVMYAVAGFLGVLLLCTTAQAQSKWSYVALVAGQTADAVTTAHARQVGAVEHGVLVPQSVGGMIAVKATTAIGSVVVMRLLATHGHPKLAGWWGVTIGVAGATEAMINRWPEVSYKVAVPRQPVPLVRDLTPVQCEGLGHCGVMGPIVRLP